MTPNVRDVLQGVAVALATPPSPEVGMAYTASRIGMVSTLAMLAAGEADRAARDATTENAAIRGLFAEASAYDADGALAAAAAETDADLSVPALDAGNARLRRLLIGLHEKVEAANDAGLNRQIVALYVRMAQIRRMALGGLNMRLWLGVAAVLAVAGAAHAAGTKTVKDWTAVCNNLGDCTAFGFSGEGADTPAYLMIQRQAGPAAQPTVVIVYGSNDKQPPQTWTLALDNKPIAGIGPVRAAGSDNGARATLSGAAAQHVIDALRNGQGLELDAGGKSLEEISLAGSAATLLWVDDQQGRVGTVTALTKKGAAPASSVHPRLGPPLVRPAPPASQAGLPKHAPKSLIKSVSDCDFDASGGEPDDTIARLAPGVVLWGPECDMAAYNETSVFFIGDEHAGHLKRVIFPGRPAPAIPTIP